MLRQRLFWLIIPFAIFAIVGLVVLAQLPPLYESRALLLVEDQQVPDSYVQSTIQSEAEQRLRRVRAEVLARDNVIRIGERFEVFGDERLSRSEKEDIMDDRSRISIERTQTSRRRDEPSSILTTIAFEHEDPERAQRVANELMTQFMATIVEIRTEQAGYTTDFLLEEERKVRRAIDGLGEQIAEIKEDNPNALPDNRRLYESTLQRVVIEKDRIEGAIAQAETELRVLEVQRPIFEGASRMSPEEEELRQRRRLLAQARRQYQETYPDVIALKEEVLDLERDIDPEAFRENAREEVELLGEQLADASEGSLQYERIARRRDELQRQLDALPDNARTTSTSEASYSAQLLTLQSKLESLQQQRENAERQIADLEARLARVPAVETQLYVLEQEQERLERELVDLQRNRAEAERSQSLESQQKGERVLVIEQPIRADEPSSPDKPRLAVLIFGFSAALAGALVLIPEVLFAKVQSKSHLEELLPDTKIIEVPRFKTADERTPKRVATASLATASVVLTVALSWTAYQTLF